MEGILLPVLRLEPWMLGMIYAALAAMLTWRLFGEGAFLRSRLSRRLDRVMSDGDVSAPAASPLRRKLLAAGLDWPEGRFYMVSAALGCGAFLAGAFLNLPPLLLVAAAGAGLYAPTWYINARAAQQTEKIDRELPLALQRIAALLKIQPDIAQVLAATAQSLAVAGETPLSQEFRRTAAEIRTLGTEQALLNLARRSPSPSLDNLALMLRVYAQAGGDFAAVMSGAAERGAGILEGRNRASAKAGEATTAAKLLPLFLAFVFFFALSDPEFSRFYHSETGQFIIIAVGGLMLYGYNLIANMIREVV